MKVELLDAKQVGEKLNELIEVAEEFYCAVAWATEVAFAKKLVKHSDKIWQMIIGTDFAQTSPEVLTLLQNVDGVRIMPDNKISGTFHPKIYCFIKGKKCHVIIGSSNLTKGGICNNQEASILIEGNAEDEVIQESLEIIDYWWNEGNEIDDNFLKYYQAAHEIRKQHKKAIEKPLTIYTSAIDAPHRDLMFKTWNEYVKSLKNSEWSKEITGRLDTLKYAHKLFSKNNFNDLTEIQRKAISGIIGDNEAKGEDVEKFGWLAFGSMTGAGLFKEQIIKNNPHISRALDFIPFSGLIEKQHYDSYKKELLLAFDRGGINVATATRLLAMKRPDYFLCINDKNERGLAKDLGFAYSTLSLDNYWERVIEPIIQSLWWNEEHPSANEKMIWNTRTAMLDIIYFKW
jgi:HKD family nuclease